MNWRSRMSIEQELIEAGYKKSVSSHYELLKMTDTLYQKCVKDDLGKRYYINAWLYTERLMPNGSMCPEGVMFEVQFWTIGKQNDDGDYVDVTLSTNDVQMAETEFYDIWRRMGYGYYESILYT